MSTEDLSIEGAREARAVVKAFHTLLNSPGLVPEQCYRMSKIHYSLVSYVNNMVGLFLSKNYDVIPVFIGRAAKHMEDFPATPSASAYYVIVSKYLAQMAYFLRSFTSVSKEEILCFVPASVLNAGAQPAPNTMFDADAQARGSLKR